MASSKSKSRCDREKKRNLLRRQLHQLNNETFRRECADLILALRYMRLRNQEVGMLRMLVRLQRCVREQSKRENNGQILVRIKRQKEWTSTERKERFGKWRLHNILDTTLEETSTRGWHSSFHLMMDSCFVCPCFWEIAGHRFLFRHNFCLTETYPTVFSGFNHRT